MVVHHGGDAVAHGTLVAPAGRDGGGGGFRLGKDPRFTQVVPGLTVALSQCPCRAPSTATMPKGGALRRTQGSSIRLFGQVEPRV